MGVFSQIFLLLWKNVLLRLRYPGVFILEVIWPVFIIGLVAIMRTGVPPYKKSDCHYQPRAMPSSGVVPFLQTFVCNLDNPCYLSETLLNNAQDASRSFSALSQDIGPYLGSKDVEAFLKVSNKSVNVISSMKTVIGDKELLNGLERVMNVSNYFRDPDKVKDILVNDFKLFPQHIADAVMASKFNVAKILNLTGTPDFRKVACDPRLLGSYIKFPPGSNVTEISRMLCNVNDSDIADLSNRIITQLNVTRIVEALKLFEEVKEKFDPSNTLSLVFEEVANMFELVMSSKSIIKLLGDIASIPRIGDLIRKIPDWIESFSNFNDVVYALKDMVFSLEPLMVSLGVDNSSIWSAVNNAVILGQHFIDLVDEKWNGTSEEFIKPLNDLIKDVEQMAKDEGVKEAIFVLEFLSKIDWIDVYDQIIHTRTLNERTVVEMLNNFETMMKVMPGWTNVQTSARLTQHALDMMSIFIEKSIELKHALKNLFDSNEVMKKEVSRIFQHSPVVTKALLEAFIDTDVLADVMRNASSYQEVCDRVMVAVQPKIPPEVYTDIYNILCTGDVMEALSGMTESLKLSEISDVFNTTVTEIEHLYEGDFFSKIVPLSRLYYHYNRFTTALNNYLYDDYKWMDVFKDINMDSVDFNEVGWEPVTDMLNNDFLTSGLLGMYRGFGEVLVDSRVSDEVAPYVYMMSQMTKMVYEMMHNFTKSYSSDSPLMKAVDLFTTYMPEMVTGVVHMWDTNMDALYKLASSYDPLGTFCIDNYMRQMDMPAYVPVDEMSKLICDTSWTVVIEDMQYPAMSFETMFTKMMDIFTLNETATYDVELDWIDMVDYSERIMDMLNTEDISKMEFMNGYMTLIDNMNFTKLGIGLDILIKELGNMTTDDMEKLLDISLRVMESLDKTSGSDSQWQDLKWYIAWMEAAIDLQLNMTGDLQDSNSLQYILAMYPPEVKEMTFLLAKAYPQFVTALKNILLDPDKLMDKLLKEGLQTPDCKSHFVSDYTLLPPDSHVHDLEKFFCELNFTALSENLMESSPAVKAYSDRVIELLENMDAPVTIDWSQLIDKVNRFLEQLTAPMTFSDNFDLSPFNLTAIDIAWNDFYAAAETLSNFDMEKFQSLAFKIQGLFVKLTNVDNNTDMAVPLYANLYISHHFYKLLSTELSILNASTEVVIADYLWSSELKKLTDLLVQSPDINAVGVATLQRLLTSPETATITTDFDALCSDLALFSKVFVVDASPLSPALLQKTVCDVNINVTLLWEQVLNNRASVKKFVDAMDIFSRELTLNDVYVDPEALFKNYEHLQKLIEDLITHPPTFKLTANEDWMNMILYKQAWENLGERLDILGQDLQNSSIQMDWQSSMARLILTTIEKTPGMEEALGYIDGILDIMLEQIDQTNDPVGVLKKYPNARKAVELVESAPEAIQVIMYTVLTQPDKTARWGDALQSWTKFCNTPTSEIMSVPPGLNFDMAAFLDKACQIDIDELMTELAKVQGTDRLENLLTNGTSSAVNSSTVSKKLDRYLERMTTTITDPGNMEGTALARLFNTSVWEQIADRIMMWSDKTSDDYSSPEKIAEMVLEMLKVVSGNMSEEFTGIFDMGLAISDVMLDQMLHMLEKKTLNDAFEDLPTMQAIAGLLNELPELYEAMLYTSMYHPEKLSSVATQFSSYDAFCANAPDMLVMPPNSTFDFKDWVSRLCAINTTVMVDELMEYSLAKDLENIINGMYSSNATITSVAKKADQLVKRFEEGVTMNDRIFDPTVWSEVMDQINKWPAVTTSTENLLKDWSNLVMKSLLITLEDIPGTDQALGYISVILDMVQKQLDVTIDGYDGLKSYPNGKIVMGLVEEVPQLMQVLLYTVLTQPAKTARWSEALQSWTKFCSTPTGDIMSVPPGLTFDIVGYLDEACKIDIEALAQEMAEYQGTDKLEKLFSGTGNPDTGVNASTILEKFNKVVDTVTDLVDNPADMSDTMFARLFNTTVWEEIGARIEKWSDFSAENYRSPEQIFTMASDLVMMIAGNMSKEVTEIFDKTVAVTDILLGQMLVILDAGSLNGSFHDVPSMQILAELMNEFPELLETLLYTSTYHPEKISDKVSSLTSLEDFCQNNPKDMLVLAPNSTFDLDSWLRRLCTINVTKLVEELEDYTVTRQIEQIINGPSTGTVNITSVVKQVERIVEHLNKGLDMKDRIFDRNVWDQMVDRINSWVWPENSVEDMIKGWSNLVMKSLLTTLEEIPGSEQALGYISVILDMVQKQLDVTIDGYDGLKMYPNAKIVMELVEEVPELMQVLLYTVLTQPAKTAQWGDALQSWTKFCGTPTGDIMSVPPGLTFDIVGYLDKACKIDIEALAQEMAEYQGTDKLEKLFSGTGSPDTGVNASTILEKFNKLVDSMTDFVNNPADMSDAAFARLFNATVWDEIGTRIETWSDFSAENYRSPEQIVKMASDLVLMIAGNMSKDVTEIFDKTVAVTDILLGQMLVILDAGPLNGTFHDVPSMQTLVELMNEFPELLETLLYTSMYFPDKISAKVSNLTSLEGFCLNNPKDMLVLAPNSTFDLDSWLRRLCTINVTKLVEELEDYTVTKQIEQIINGPYNGPVNITSVVKQVEKIIEHLNAGLDMGDRIFDRNVWDQMVDRVNSWIWPYNSFADFMKVEQKRVMKSFIAYVENTPGSEDMVRYVDAILDIIGNRVEESQMNLPEAFKDFPTLKTILELVEHAPEMIETALYTVLTQPDKTAAWGEALQSFSAFCGTKVSTIMVAAPGSGFDVEAYLAKLCSVDIDKLVSEMADYQGFDRLSKIAEGNDTSVVNMTALLKKADHIFDSLGYYYDNPFSAVTMDLRLFNETVWEHIGKRIENWATNMTMTNYLSATTMTKIIEMTFGPMLDQSPVLKDVYDRALAMTSVLVNEIFMVIEASSLREAYAGVPSLQKLIDLANQAPELYEVLVYTSVFHPEKLSTRAQSLTSFEGFCSANPDDMFSVPPDSTFDIRSWFNTLCALNFTEVEKELGDYKTGKDIENIVRGSPGSHSNLTSLVDKIERLIQRMDQGVNLNDRILNDAIWTEVMNRVDKWIGNYTLESALLSPEAALQIMARLMDADPALAEILKPVVYVGAVMESLVDTVLALENKTHFGAADLFEGWTSMQNLVNLIQMPGVIEMAIASATSENFMSLFTNESSRQDFCRAGSDPAKYLKQPDNMNVDLHKIQMSFCGINFNDFLDQFDKFLDTERLMRVVDGTEDMDWNRLQQKVTRLDHLITVTWRENPPTFDLPEQWTNATYWTNLFESEFASLDERLGTKEQLQSIIRQMKPILDMDGFKQMGIVLSSVLDILNENIASMENANYALGNVMQTIPALNKLFSSLGIDSDTMTTLMLAPVKNSTRFAELFLSDDFKADFCNTDKWRQIIDFPNNFDTSGLFTAVCRDDMEPLVNSLKQSFNLESMIDALNGNNSSHTQDWDKIVDKVFTMIDNLEAVMKNPPTFSTDEILEKLEKSYTDTTQLWKMLGAFSALQQSFGNEPAMSQQIEGILRISNVLVDYLNEMVARLKVQNGHLDLASLFKEVPEFVRVISGALDVEPDPLTGMFAVQLKPAKVDTFVTIVSNSSELKQLFCNDVKFKDIFQVRSDVNLTSLQTALCNLDFDTISEKLMDSLKINTLGDDLTNAWNVGGHFDAIAFSENMELLIERITNLTTTDYLMFEGHDLGDLLKVNATRLLEELTSQYTDVQDAIMNDYVSVSAAMLNSLLSEMGTVTEIKTLTLALRFVQVYLHSFNTFLKSIKDQPISLPLLLNNTEVGKIINPLLDNPHMLDGLVNSNINVKKLASLLESTDPSDALCLDQLWTAIDVPANESQSLRDLQARACSANQSLVLWQTIMMQANGYQLYEQMKALEKEIDQGKTSLNATAISEEMKEFISLMETIIGQYMNGSRSLNDLLDLDSFQQVLDKAQRKIAQKLMDSAKSWSVDLADVILPKIMDNDLLQNMAKTLNTINLFMNITIQKLQGIRDGQVSSSTLFTNADGLVNLIEAYIRVGKNIAQAWMDKEFDSERLVSLFTNTTELQALCAKPDGLAHELSNQMQPSKTVMDLSTVVCSVVDDTFMKELQKYVDYDDIGKQLDNIWKSSQVIPNYSAFANNVEEFTNIIEELANKSLTINSSLTDMFDFTSMLDALQNIANDPKMIFRLMKLLGVVIEDPLKQQQELVQVMSGINTFAVMPVVKVLEALKAKGMTLNTIASDPEKLLDTLSIMVDFNVHYAVIETVVVKSQLNYLVTNKDYLCNSSAQEGLMVSQGLDHMTLPVPWRDIWDMICRTSDPHKMLENMKAMGLTKVQIVAVLDKMIPVGYISSLPDMYDHDFGWIDMMSSLEQLTDLVTQGNLDKSDVNSMKDAWEAVKDILFDKSLRSLLSYLNLMESSAGPDDNWITFKQFLRFFSSALKFINGHMDKFAQGEPVQLQDVLPDSDRVASLLEDVFGTNTVAEFLTTFVDPIMYYRLSIYDSWDEVCKGSKPLTDYFHFPAGTDVSAIKQNLCQAVTTRSSSFEELISLIDAGDMLKQVDMLIQNEFNATAHNDTVWDAVYSAVRQLLHTAEQLQNSQISAESANSWFKPIVNFLESLQASQSSQLITMCNAMVKYLSNTEEYSQMRQPLSMMITAVNLATNLSRLLPDLDEVTCIFVNETSYDIIGAVRKLTRLGLWDDLKRAIDQFVNPPMALDCSAPIAASEKIMKNINITMSNDGLDVGKMSQCMANAGKHFRSMLTSFSQTLNFMKDIVAAMQMPELQKILRDPNIIPVLDFLVDIIKANKEVLVGLSDLLQDKASAADYLVHTLGLPQSLVDSFMNATVNNDWAYFLGEPVQVVEEILCMPEKLSKVIRLPKSSPVNVTDISKIICTAEINNMVMVLKNLSAPAADIAKLIPVTSNSLLDVIIRMTDTISDIITQFGDIIQLSTSLLTDFNINTLKENVDLIDELIQGNSLSILTKSFHKVLDELEKVLPSNSVTTMVMNDIRMILDGILGLDIIKDSILVEVKVKDLVKEPKYMMFQLRNEFGFHEDVIQAIMDGVFSSRLFLDVESQPKYKCDEVLKMILIMNNTGATVKSVSDAVCALSEKQLIKLMEVLTPELDVGTLIAKYVTYTGKSILSSTNLTNSELDDVVQKIDRGLANLKRASDVIKKSRNGTDILNVFSKASSSAFMSMDKLTPALCGGNTVDVFSMEYTPGVLVTSTDAIEEEIRKGIISEEADLPNEFCIELYESVRRSGTGSILWAYLKPIMRGQILYTPDNAVTRAIVKKAKKLFDVLEEVSRVSQMWAKETPNLLAMADAASETEELKDALENDFVQGLVEATIGVNSDTLISGLDALQANNFDRSQLEALQSAAEVVANYTSCIVTDRFKGVASEEELEQEAYQLSRNKTFFAGIVFLNAGEDDSTSSSSGRKKRQAVKEIPKHVGYKIRMDVDNVMDTSRLKSNIWNMAAEANFIEDLRYLRGFIYIQDMLDNAIIDLQKNEIYSTPGFKIRQFPYPCHHLDNFIFLLGSYLVPVMMTFTFLASLGVATHNLVYDRENGQEENLHVMGMVKGINFISWLASTMILMCVVCIILAVMLKYTDIFIYSDISIIFLFLVDFCFSSVMLLYMVSAFFDRTTMAILFVLMVYLISYMPYILVLGLEVSMTFWQKTAASLASTTAFSFGALRLSYLEENGVGVQWDNIRDERDDNISVSWLCIMMLIDSAIYFVIGWYVRHVRAGKFGISQPWYFPLKPSFWCSCLRSGTTTSSAAMMPHGPTGKMFEPPPVGLPVGIAVEDLSKTYGNKTVAVENLNISFYKNQITSLLGHNGAAKTTTLNMICGVLEPTSGRVLVDGTNSSCCKHKLGMCPQQNALFYYMTVKEHMKFYAGIKGATNEVEILAEIRRLLKDVDLWHARNTTVRDLSYGMKRRLCVALAFVGDSKTIILDEPTSGVDPHARKNIWNLIMRNRPGRVILLSTHHLDEADILSDRIAVMHSGKLLCCGSPAFLKKSLGGGFHLTVVKKEQAMNRDSKEQSKNASSTIDTYIKSMCPGATLVEQVGTDLTFDLPKDPASMNVTFYEFFKQLDENSDKLGIASYGLSDTTLEEVFLQLTHKADSDLGVVNPAMSSTESSTTLTLDAGKTASHPTNNQSSTSSETKKRRSGAALTFSQIGALWMKRFHHYRRNWRMWLSAIVLPIIFFLISMGFTTVRVNEGDMKQLVLDPSIYGPNSYSFYQDTASNMLSYSFVETIRDDTVGIGTSCMRDWAEDYFNTDQCQAPSPWYNYSTLFYMVGCKNARQVYSEIYQSNVVVLEKILASRNYVQDLEQQNVASYLLRTFRDYKDKRFGGWSFETSATGQTSDVDPYVWFNSKGYHAMPSFFNSLSNIVLRSQLPAGQNPKEYGITTVNHPLKLGRAALTVKNLQGEAADAGIALMIVVAFSFIPCGFILYVINERVQKERQLQNISGIHYLTYWIVTLIWDMIIYAFIVGIAVIIVVIFRTDSFYVRDNLGAFAVILLLYGWAIIPCLYFMSRLFNKSSTAFLVTFCLNMFLVLATVISLLVMQLFRQSDDVWRAYKVCKYLYLIFPQYALGQGLMDMVSNTVKYKLFMRFGDDKYDNPYSTDIIGWNLIALAAEGAFFFLLTLFTDGMKAPAIGLTKRDAIDKNAREDDDVARERERVKGSSTSDMLVIDDLSKVYRRGWRKFLAVNHVSFGVPEGECFGLLGVNGAGKTTTFRMLTGDLKPAGGIAMLKGHKLSQNDHNFGQDVGYCPQEGGLDEYLTGEETLYFHSRLRGFNAEQTKEIVAELLTRMGLNPYAKKVVNSYSGGTKRKLALAVALLGDPPILYLDEPTTGMDAGTRRLAWKCIAQANRNGQSVVLTSHSMDECDTLCSRIAIMINGQIKCIGSPQHLKHKFGDGYTVVMHANPDELSGTIHHFLHRFPGAVIKTKHNTSVELRVPQASGSVADMLATLQKAQEDQVIEYYSLSQTTLDSVFVSFAQEQTDNYEDDVSTSRGSSSDAMSDSPSGSVSSTSQPSSSEYPTKPPPSKYVFMNPQYVSDEGDAPPMPAATKAGNNYAHNIKMASQSPKPVSPEDITITKL